MLGLIPMGIGEKIKQLRDKMGMSQGDLAAIVGVRQPTIAQLEGGDNKTSKHIFKIASALGVHPHDLDPDIPAPSQAITTEMYVMGEVRAGMWLEVDGDLEPVGTIPALPDARYAGRRQYALKVVGSSMNLVAKPGIYVVIADWADHGAELKDGDVVVVRRERAHTYEVTLKRLKMGKKQWELWPESDDPKHQEPILLEAENPEWTVSVVGKVVGKYEPL